MSLTAGRPSVERVQEELEEVVSVEAFSESVVALRTPSIPDWLCEGLLVSVG